MENAMKRILFLVAAFFITSSFVSGPVRPLLPDTPMGPTHPVIVDPYQPPAGAMSFTNPDDPSDSFTARISVDQGGFTIWLDSSRFIDYVVFANLSTDRIIREWVYQRTNLIQSHFNMSNGHWRIQIVTVNGTHYLTDIMVSNSAFGPLVPCDWIDEGYYEGPGAGFFGEF
jgi:hypothetical protein